MTEKIFSCEWLGRTLTIKTGKLARQANAAVTAQYGDTVVLATVVEAKEEREGIDFFPLMVDFEERLYAAGIIKGSRWIKREGRPSDEAVLTARMVDRAIRPLFNDKSRRDIQVIITVLSADQVNDFDIVSLIAASAALSISGAEWKGPIGGVRVGRIDGEFIFNPTYEEREKSDLDLIVAGTPERVIMIEAGAKEVKEDDVLKAIIAGQKELAKPIELIKQMTKEIEVKEVKGFNNVLSEEEKEKEQEEERMFKLAEEWLKNNVKDILFSKIRVTKEERKEAVNEIKTKLDEYLLNHNINKDNRNKIINSLVKKAVEKEVSRMILEKKRRIDGRALDEIRPIEAEAGVLPRIHGSGLFSRGETQVMSIVTLGPPGVEQLLEGLEGSGTKRYIHHYNFPPYSVGEVKPSRAPSRRDIGHGALAEKALLPVLPSREEFPYTIRVVSETLSSNGSSSMAATCGSSLSLMDAGVPIKKAVAGIAMGLVSTSDMSKWEVITDLQDLEDGEGGMDFKIAGTADGITAIQLDTKTEGLTREIIERTLKQGLKARLKILEIMNRAIDKPRPDLSPYAPRIVSFHINPERIRDVIGVGGKVINKIISAHNVSIDIEEDGLVMVTGTDQEETAKAVHVIKSIARDFAVGEIIKGKVTRMLDFGAFIEIAPGREGMVHVSELAPYHINKPEDFLSVGDEVTVRVKGIDDQGRINLSMLGLPQNEILWVKHKNKQTQTRQKKFFNQNKFNRFNDKSKK